MQLIDNLAYPDELFQFTPRLRKLGDDYIQTLLKYRLVAFKTAVTAKRVKDIVIVGKDAKTVKGRKYGFDTGITYMSPADICGFELCPSRTPGCSAACLYTAGQGRFPSVKIGRMRRAYQFLFRPDEFMDAVIRDIDKGIKNAKENNREFAVRLNGTSDIAYEDIPVRGGFENIFHYFEDIPFYDYTKVFPRLLKVANMGIKNYHLTFSRAETSLSQEQALKALEIGANITVVFRNEIPPVWRNVPVINGDDHDLRFWNQFKRTDGGPIVVGLLAKGEAKHDTSGFVVG